MTQPYLSLLGDTCHPQRLTSGTTGAYVTRGILWT